MEGKPPDVRHTFVMQLGHGHVYVLRFDLCQLEVGTVCEASLAASLHPAQQPVQKLPIPADLQGAQPSKREVGSAASRM